MRKELLKGSIDILLLSELSHQDQYGFEITQGIKKKSNDAYTMSEGTLYSALKRLEQKGFLESYWGDEESLGGRRKYYHITQDGLRQLEEQVQQWKEVNQLIQLCTGVM